MNTRLIRYLTVTQLVLVGTGLFAQQIQSTDSEKSSRDVEAIENIEQLRVTLTPEQITILENDGLTRDEKRQVLLETMTEEQHQMIREQNQHHAQLRAVAPADGTEQMREQQRDHLQVNMSETVGEQIRDQQRDQLRDHPEIEPNRDRDRDRDRDHDGTEGDLHEEPIRDQNPEPRPENPDDDFNEPPPEPDHEPSDPPPPNDNDRPPPDPDQHDREGRDHQRCGGGRH